MCPRLTEFTAIIPHLYWAELSGKIFLLNWPESAHSAVLDLVGACRALPDFDTLQIARFPIVSSRRTCLCLWYESCTCDRYPTTEWEEAFEKQMKDLGGWTVDCLKLKTGCQEGEGRGRTAFRVIKFSSDRPCQSSVEVEEYEV